MYCRPTEKHPRPCRLNGRGTWQTTAHREVLVEERYNARFLVSGPANHEDNNVLRAEERVSV